MLYMVTASPISQALSGKCLGVPRDGRRQTREDNGEGGKFLYISIWKYIYFLGCLVSQTKALLSPVPYHFSLSWHVTGLFFGSTALELLPGPHH